MYFLVKGFHEMQIGRNTRVRRVSQEIQRKISVILQNEINDPRVGVLTVSEVCISKDLKNAKVFVTFLDKETASEISVAIMVLRRASRFIRFLLAQSIHLRIVPVLLFKYDASLIQGVKLCNLISHKS